MVPSIQVDGVLEQHVMGRSKVAFWEDPNVPSKEVDDVLADQLQPISLSKLGGESHYMGVVEGGGGGGGGGMGRLEGLRYIGKRTGLTDGTKHSGGRRPGTAA